MLLYRYIVKIDRSVNYHENIIRLFEITKVVIGK
jgi:hypothetical protein